MQMNWNPFKQPVQDEAIMDITRRVNKLEQTSVAQAMEEIRGLRLLVQQLQTSIALLESNSHTHGELIDSELQSKLEKEKTAYKRAYAREYYYRKKANQPTLKQLQMVKRKKLAEEQK
jgi:hypothetical protein